MTVLPVGQSRYLSRFSGSFSHSRYSRERAELHPSVFAFGFESEEEEEELLESEDELFESEDDEDEELLESEELLDSLADTDSLCASFSRERLRVP
jgi:hypothetical protein